MGGVYNLYPRFLLLCGSMCSSGKIVWYVRKSCNILEKWWYRDPLLFLSCKSSLQLDLSYGAGTGAGTELIVFCDRGSGDRLTT